jgi:glyoxylase-like metal-dependent hydrolase (beta-lactamase superfamily II)
VKAAEVAEGVYRLGTKWANFYVVVEDAEAIVVDTGYPRYWSQLVDALNRLDVPLGGVRAVFVTHHHVDHAGCAERLRSETGATVFVGDGDAPKVSGAEPSHPPDGFYRSAWRASMIRYLAHTVRVGGARYRPVHALTDPDYDLPLALPGQPEVIATPGHTAGHYSVVLRSRGVLFTGDALMNFDYASGRAGVKLHRFNEDRSVAEESLTRLEAVGAPVLLFGHGDPWTEGAEAAVATARERIAVA